MRVGTLCIVWVSPILIAVLHQVTSARLSEDGTTVRWDVPRAVTPVAYNSMPPVESISGLVSLDAHSEHEPLARRSFSHSAVPIPSCESGMAAQESVRDVVMQFEFSSHLQRMRYTRLRSVSSSIKEVVNVLI